MATTQSTLQNENVKGHFFLKEMYNDSYFPTLCVNKGKDILIDLCFQIEAQQPANLDALYKLTHASTEKFNDLQELFEENGSEIETAARENIAADFEFIAKSYGFTEADVEELIAPREW
ncbi:hypothetical protein CNR22_23665 [Sphingobacteriaceae bacterium]|nr:hypothetical protein CNR22_23665 [Sphingobacteriaceae bacterium]